MSDIIYTPYTYLIGWKKFNLWYYGVRYAKGCHPTELMVSYFTSSKHIHKLIEDIGAPDIQEIRRTFNNKHNAIEWENKVLRRMDVMHNDLFVNKTNNKAIPINPDPYKNIKPWVEWRTGRSNIEVYGEEVANRLSNEISNRTKRLWAEGKMNSSKPEDTTNYKLCALRRWADDDFKNKQKSRKRMNNGHKEVFALPENFQDYLDQGYIFGRIPKLMGDIKVSCIKCRKVMRNQVLSRHQKSPKCV